MKETRLIQSSLKAFTNERRDSDERLLSARKTEYMMSGSKKKLPIVSTSTLTDRKQRDSIIRRIQEEQES